MRRFLLVVLLLLPLCALGQQGQYSTIRPRSSDPATCQTTQGGLFWDTVALEIKVCTATNTWTAVGGGGGTGTVTSFTAGTLVPLFTTSVATGTTTPVLSFTLSAVAAHKTFMNNTALSAVPAFESIGVLDLPFTYTGNTTKLTTYSGSSPVNGNCASWDSSGNLNDFGGACGGGGGGGTVTHVGLVMPTGFGVANSPVTASADLTVTMPTSWTTGDLLLGNGSNSVTRLPIGTNGLYLKSDGTTASWAAGASGGTPGGADTAIQFNNSSSFGGDATNFSYNSSTHAVITTGAMSAASYNNVTQANVFAGADAGAKIVAAIAAGCPLAGGVIDARGLIGAQAISATITVPAYCQLLFGAGQFTSTVTPIFLVNNGSQIKGSSFSASATQGTIFYVPVGTAGSAVRCQDQTVSGCYQVILESLRFFHPAPVTADGSIAVDFLAAYEWTVKNVMNSGFDTGFNFGGTSRGSYYDSCYDCISLSNFTRGFYFNSFANQNTLFHPQIHGGSGLLPDGIDFAANATNNLILHEDVEAPCNIANDVNGLNHTFIGSYIESCLGGYKMESNTTGLTILGGSMSSTTVPFDNSALTTQQKQLSFIASPVIQGFQWPDYFSSVVLTPTGATEQLTKSITSHAAFIQQAFPTASPAGLVRTSNIVTATYTTIALAPAIGSTVEITGTTAVGATNFNSNNLIVCGPPTTGCIVPTTTKATWAQTAADDTGGGGYLKFGGKGQSYGWIFHSNGASQYAIYPPAGQSGAEVFLPPYASSGIGALPGLGLTNNGDFTIAQLAAPTLGRIDAVCSASCSNTWGYKIVAKDVVGTSAASSQFTTAVGSPNLSGATNENLIYFNLSVGGAQSYDVYKTSVPGTCLTNCTTGKIGTVAIYPATGVLTFADTGINGDGTTAPTTNTTGFLSSAAFKVGLTNKAIFDTTLLTGSRTFTFPNSSGTLCTTVTCPSSATGTVTNFSAGDLAPLFTSSVATSTTTPVLSFSLSTAAAHKTFMNNTGSTAAPGFQSIGTADLPFTYSGNTTKLATTTGSLVSGNCVKTDVSGNFIDAAGTCGGGTPGGTDTAIQVNHPLGTLFGDATNFNYDSTTHKVTTTGDVSAANLGLLAGGVVSSADTGTPAITFSSSAVSISGTGSPADYISIPTYTPGPPAIVSVEAAGSDTDISLNLVSKGTGQVLANGIPIGNNTYIYVTSYGAVGNSSTGDDVTLQAAIDACPATGCTLFFPTGTYYVAGTNATITNVAQTLFSATFTATNSFTTGDYVTVSGMSDGTLNGLWRITSRTGSQFVASGAISQTVVSGAMSGTATRGLMARTPYIEFHGVGFPGRDTGAPSMIKSTTGANPMYLLAIYPGSTMDGPKISQLGFQDATTTKVLMGGLLIVNSNSLEVDNNLFFNFTCAGKTEGTDVGYGCGTGLTLSGGGDAGITTGYTQWGTIFNNSFFLVKRGVATRANVASISFSGSNNIQCYLTASPVAGTIGLDFGDTFGRNYSASALGVPSEMFIFGTQIQNCDIGLAGYNLHHGIWAGKAELLGAVIGRASTIGARIDGTSTSLTGYADLNWSSVGYDKGISVVANARQVSIIKQSMTMNTLDLSVANDAISVPLVGWGYTANKVAQVAAIVDTAMQASTSVDAVYKFDGVINCTVVDATATATLNLKYFDTSNTAQTVSVTATCATLGAASVGSINTLIREITGHSITYGVTIANTPTYDVSVRLEQK